MSRFHSDSEKDSTSTDSDENQTEIIDENFEKKFLKTITALKSGQISQIKNLEDEESEIYQNEDKKQSQKKKPVYLKDYEIDMILNNREAFEESENQNISTNKTFNNSKTSEELNIIKKINQKIDEIPDDDIFHVKEESKKEDNNKIPENLFEDKDENSKFLKDYIFNKKYICPTEDIIKNIQKARKMEEKDDSPEDTKELISCPRNLPSSRISKITRAQKKKKQKENKIMNKLKKLETLKKENLKKNKELIKKIKKLENNEENDLKSEDETLKNYLEIEENDEHEAEDESENKISKRKLKKLKRIEKNKKKLKKEDDIDPDDIDEHLANEYCHMDYEDIIDDTPVRFNYRKVPPASYGLTPEEILLADDKELNKWCSLKKVITYNEESEDKKLENMYKRRIKNHKIRNRILTSLYNKESKINVKKARNKTLQTLKPIMHSNRDRLIKRFFRQAKPSVVEKISTDRLLAYNLQNDTKYNKNKDDTKNKT